MTQSNSTTEKFDRVIIGAGIFGLYAALKSGQAGCRTLVIDRAPEAFTKASYINQARIHAGYHYPRSLSTAEKTAHYVERFVKEFPFAVNGEFKQVYAIAKQFSYTDKEAFEAFCKRANIPFTPISVDSYMNTATVEAAYETKEYGFVAGVMKEYLLTEIEKTGLVTFVYGSEIIKANKEKDSYKLSINAKDNQRSIETQFILNCTYAGINEVIKIFQSEQMPIKYEYAELALCSVSPKYSALGVTVMDGPFFSLMPFGNSGFHSLTSVSYTPHFSKTDSIVEEQMSPVSRFVEMSQTAHKYMAPDFEIKHQRSLFTTKALLAAAELDDARPTCINVHSQEPFFASVLSGKLNTLFDLDEVL